MSTETDKFAIFILSHGRADRVQTVEALKGASYKGDWYIVIDDEDDQADDYVSFYGDRVVLFDKREAEKHTDKGDNVDNRGVVVFARNEVFNIAKSLGYDYMLVLDDDYKSFVWRKVVKKEDGTKVLNRTEVKDLNAVIDIFLKFLKESPADCVCMGQTGDLIGGMENGNFQKGYIRKIMNSFFFPTDSKVRFYGRINEDATTYTYEGSQGRLFLTSMRVFLEQTQTQANPDGLTTAYKRWGTYVKTFYSVMWTPSAVKVSMMGSSEKRVHHKVNWNNCVPKIIREEYKKPGR